MNQIKLQSNQIEIIKWLAVIFMVMDHYLKLFYPFPTYLPVFYEVGKLVFPLFAIILAYNYIYNTSNKLNYIKRLFYFGLFAQIPYSIMTQSFMLNIFMVLSGGLLIYYIYEKMKIEKEVLSKSIFLAIIMILLPILSLISDYRPMGLLIVLIAILLIKRTSIITWILYLSSIILANYYYWNFAPMFIGLIIATCLLPIFIIFIQSVKLAIPRINKWFFYFIYPVHISILLIIKYYTVHN